MTLLISRPPTVRCTKTMQPIAVAIERYGGCGTDFGAQVLEPAERIARAVGVHRAKAAGVPGVHRVDEFHGGIAAADLAEDDSVRPVAQRELYQCSHADVG